MMTHLHTSGGRGRVRRRVVSAIVLIGAIGAIGAAPLWAADDREQAAVVTVTEARGVYTVNARFGVPQPPGSVRAVLTDYESIPKFMPGVRSSVVLERGTARMVVEQEGVSRFMLFSKRVHLVLDVTETTDRLSFRDRCGRSFSRYEGSWRYVPSDAGTDIVYQLTAQPSFDVPELILKRLLKRDSGQMIDALRKEIAARPQG